MNYYNCFRDVISGLEIVDFSFYLLQFYLYILKPRGSCSQYKKIYVCMSVGGSVVTAAVREYGTIYKKLKIHPIMNVHQYSVSLSYLSCSGRCWTLNQTIAEIPASWPYLASLHVDQQCARATCPAHVAQGFPGNGKPLYIRPCQLTTVVLVFSEKETKSIIRSTKP